MFYILWCHVCLVLSFWGSYYLLKRDSGYRLYQRPVILLSHLSIYFPVSVFLYTRAHIQYIPLFSIFFLLLRSFQLTIFDDICYILWCHVCLVLSFWGLYYLLKRDSGYRLYQRSVILLSHLSIYFPVSVFFYTRAHIQYISLFSPFCAIKVVRAASI